LLQSSHNFLLTYFDQPVLHLLVFPSVLVSPAMFVFSCTSPHASPSASPRVSPHASGLKSIRILSGLFPDFDRASFGEQFGLLVSPILLCKVLIFCLYFFEIPAGCIFTGRRRSSMISFDFSVPDVTGCTLLKDSVWSWGVEVCDHFCFQFVSVFTIDGMSESDVRREWL
jgi:hypothetical protein